MQDSRDVGTAAPAGRVSPKPHHHAGPPPHLCQHRDPGQSSPGPSEPAELSRARSSWDSSAPRSARAASPDMGRCLQRRSQGMFAMRTSSLGGTGDPERFTCFPRSNSEHEWWCVAIGTSLNTVTLETTATLSAPACARPCAPRSGSLILHPRCRLLQLLSGTSKDGDRPFLTGSIAPSTAGNYHQDQSRESDPSGVPCPTGTSTQRCELNGLASPPLPPVTELPRAPHVEPDPKDPYRHSQPLDTGEEAAWVSHM